VNPRSWASRARRTGWHWAMSWASCPTCISYHIELYHYIIPYCIISHYTANYMILHSWHTERGPQRRNIPQWCHTIPFLTKLMVSGLLWLWTFCKIDYHCGMFVALTPASTPNKQITCLLFSNTAPTRTSCAVVFTEQVGIGRCANQLWGEL